MAVVYQSHSVPGQSWDAAFCHFCHFCHAELLSGGRVSELVVGGCQVQKLLFPCVTCALLVLPCSLSFSAPKHNWCPLPFPPCSQISVRLKEAEHLPQNLFWDDAQGPALAVHARLLQTSLAAVINALFFRDLWGLSWCGWQRVVTRFASNTSPGANSPHAWECQRSGTKD